MYPSACVQRTADVLALGSRDLFGLCHIAAGAKSARPLLVHLCSRGNAINREVNEFPWLDKLNHLVDPIYEREHDVVVTQALRNPPVAVGRVVNRAVHVEVEVVTFGEEGGLVDGLPQVVNVREPGRAAAPSWQPTWLISG